MTRKTRQLRQQHARLLPAVASPHPSWSRRERVSVSAAALKPDDFWSQLGL